jgi:hypothetical protein
LCGKYEQTVQERQARAAGPGTPVSPAHSGGRRTRCYRVGMDGVAPSGVVPTLTVHPSGGEPVHADGREHLTVGSDPGCDVVVAGEGIAAQHVSFSLTAGIWVVHDASGGRTYVEGQPVTRLAALTALELRLGDPATGLLLAVSPHRAAPAPPTVPQRGLDPAAVPSSRPEKPTPKRPAPVSLADLSARVRLPHVLLALVVVVPLIVWAFSR